jgi:NADPH-dependent 2,4-dienoyl-CoA reductase/sulfur reductase-like enzyme/nitrite reductase/ring-hydroxylating ferredoxin subunit
MGNESNDKPDLSRGVASADVPEGGMLVGHVGEEDVLLVRRGFNLYAIGATCSHYGAPLVDGLLVEDTIRCPWHHACFDLKTGTAARPPALNDLACWKVEEKNGKITVGERLPVPQPPHLASVGLPESIVIIGGGAAGNMAAETLRREGYEGPVTLISADKDAPYDRPTLSKDYLAGKAQPDWVPLHGREFYTERKIDLKLGSSVAAIDTKEREIKLANGERLTYGALLLATGATPARLDIPGADLPHVHVLRSFADAEALTAAATDAKSCVVIGASFIGLEVAASLRQREKNVHVVAPDKIPMARIMGEEIGKMVRDLHTSKGVVFHLERKPAAISADAVMLDNGDKIPADLVVVGIGVRPSLALAEAAGLDVEKGVLVDDYLETSVKGIYAAGDIARWPDVRSGQRIRVEHWVVAERQGQTAARNMLGRRERFDAVPFFWSQHYDTAINYVGHAAAWDDIRIDGKVAAQDFTATFVQAGQSMAVVTVGRDRAALEAEVTFENEAGGGCSNARKS